MTPIHSPASALPEVVVAGQAVVVAAVVEEYRVPG
jgi:hypothetical protein